MTHRQPGSADTIAGSATLARYLLRLAHDLVEIREGLVLAAFPRPANDPLRVHDEDGTFGHPGIPRDVLATHSVRADHLSLEVSYQIERKAAELVDECLVREDAVHTDAVNGDAAGAEFIVP